MKKFKSGRPSTGKIRKHLFNLPVTLKEREYLHKMGGSQYVRVKIFPAEILEETSKSFFDGIK